MRWSILLLFACSACAGDLSTDNFNHSFEPWVPRDVRAFIIDAQTCTHFSGEPAGDPQRQAFLDKMMRETCTNIGERAQQLRERHPSQQVQQLISDTWE